MSGSPLASFRPEAAARQPFPIRHTSLVFEHLSTARDASWEASWHCSSTDAACTGVPKLTGTGRIAQICMFACSTRRHAVGVSFKLKVFFLLSSMSSKLRQEGTDSVCPTELIIVFKNNVRSSNMDQSSSWVRRATPRFVQCFSVWLIDIGSIAVMMKLVLCPIVDKVPLRSEVL